MLSHNACGDSCIAVHTVEKRFAYAFNSNPFPSNPFSCRSGGLEVVRAMPPSPSPSNPFPPNPRTSPSHTGRRFFFVYKKEIFSSYRKDISLLYKKEISFLFKKEISLLYK